MDIYEQLEKAKRLIDTAEISKNSEDFTEARRLLWNAMQDFLGYKKAIAAKLGYFALLDPRSMAIAINVAADAMKDANFTERISWDYDISHEELAKLEVRLEQFRAGQPKQIPG